uniref:Uncharacterized protein n=1 Tax=Avena sativa TaxID=4498 RepID=A0ACD6AMZ8_AVESA
MSASASSPAGKHGRRKQASPSASQPPHPAGTPLPPPLPPGTLPLVACPCCRFRRTIRLVSQSSSNPGRVFYKCPNHRISPNPCNHYYWENGEDNYIDFLVRNGYNFGTADYGNDIAFEETEDELEESRVHKMADVVKKMDLVLKKMDELAEIGRNVFAAILFLIVIMLYVAVAR